MWLKPRMWSCWCNAMLFRRCGYDRTHGCHGKTKMQIIGPAHTTWYQQAYNVLNISCLWCFAFAMIPSLKVHLELKVFNTHVRVCNVAASWKLRKGVYHPKLPSERNQWFLNLSCFVDSIISLITVENQYPSWDDMHHSLHDLTLVRIYHVSADSLCWIVFWIQLHSCLLSGPLLVKVRLRM